MFQPFCCLICNCRLTSGWETAPNWFVFTILSSTDFTGLHNFLFLSFFGHWWQTFNSSIHSCETKSNRKQHFHLQNHSTWKNYFYFVPCLDPNKWCMMYSLHSRGLQLNPQPIGCESSALSTGVVLKQVGAKASNFIVY